MTDVITFGWGEEYAVRGNFDLNTLRDLIKVKEVGGKYVLDDPERTNIVVKVNKPVAFNREDIENAEFIEAKGSADLYKKWYNDATAKINTLEAQIKGLLVPVEDTQEGGDS